MRPHLLIAVVLAVAGCTGELDTTADPPYDAPAADRPGGPGGGGATTPGDKPGAGDPSGGESPGSGNDDGPRTTRPFVPAPPRLIRLTRTWYEASLRALLGDDLAIPDDLEPDTPLHGFTTIGAAELTISPSAARQFEAAAFSVADQVFTDGERRAALVGCDAADEACVRDFLTVFGRRAWRRPLDEDEIALLVGVAREIGASLRDPWQGLGHAVAAMLQSPDFLFRVEAGEPDPSHPDRRRYTGWEMASRLSYLLWGGPPDDALLDAAAHGALTDDVGLAEQVDRMLGDPRARAALVAFFSEALTLDRLASVTKDAEAFPMVTPALLASMRTEIERVIEDVIFEQDADLRDLLTTRTTFVDARLAAHYQMPAPDGPGFHRMEHDPDGPRGGLMSMAGILALNAHATVTSPTLRGKFVQTVMMCFDVPPPPPGVSTNLEEGEGPAGPQTMREKLSRHAVDPTCAGCHRHMDPIGLGLENFDAVGAYRTTDQGLPIDARSELDGVAFEGARELGELLRTRPQFADCVARRFYRYGNGRLESLGEIAAIEGLRQAFVDADYRMSALVRAMVLSEAFHTASEPPDEVEESAFGDENGAEGGE